MEMQRTGTLEARAKYTRVKVETSDQLSLITMLFDGIVRFVNAALDDIRNGRPAYENCKRARDIVHHLMCTLRDDGGDISRNLRSLYFFMYKQLSLASMEQSGRKLEEILPVVNSIRSAWVELREAETAVEDER